VAALRCRLPRRRLAPLVAVAPLAPVANSRNVHA
jgi:hypothetical protein